jgi:type I restriction enzyme, S subunit
MVPDGWRETTMGKLVQRVAKPVDVAPETLYRELGIRSHGKGLFDKEPVLGKTLGDKRVFWVEPNCFVVNIVFAWEQAVARTTTKDQGKIASHRFPMYRPRVGQADVDFLTYLFKTPYGKHLLALASPGGAGRNKTLGQSEFLKIKVCVPGHSEQQKIAQILITWDRAIGVADRLLLNSRTRKRALLQTLFPTVGHRGSKWKSFKLVDVADVIVSNVDKKTVIGERPVRLCNYVDVYSNDIIHDRIDFMKASATDAQVDKFMLRQGDVVITKDSEQPDDIAVPAYVEYAAPDLVCGYHLVIVRPKPGFSGKFFKYFFEQSETQRYFASRANGATRFGLSVKAIEDAEIAIPSKQEQEDITRILANAEKQIAVLHSNLELLKAEKSALMQQLLTGARCVHAAEAAA